MAIFGLHYRFENEGDQSNLFLLRNKACLPSNTADSTMYEQFFSLKTGDIIYLKDYRPRAGLSIRAVGVILPSTGWDFSRQDGQQETVCVRVRWSWYGPETRPMRFMDPPLVWTNMFYEEKHPGVQERVIELLCTRE